MKEIFKAFLWTQKFTSSESIDALKGSIASEVCFQREYLLKNIPEIDRIIPWEYINYYDSLPDNGKFKYVAAGIDLAITLIKDEYLNMVKDAGFTSVKIIDEINFPLQYIISDNTETILENDLNLS